MLVRSISIDVYVFSGMLLHEHSVEGPSKKAAATLCEDRASVPGRKATERFISVERDRSLY